MKSAGNRMRGVQRGIWAAALVLAAGWPGGMVRGQLPPALVKTASLVERAEVAAAQTFVGEVTAARQSIVGSAVGGRVVEFLVEEGQRVEKGQPLARLLTRAVEIQRDAALAQVELYTQELAELQEGSRPEEIAQAEARMLGAKSLMEYSQSKLERTKILIERRAASQEQLQDDAAIAESNLQAYYEAKAAHTLAVEGPRKEKIAQAAARLEAAKEEVARLEDQLEKHTMFAPFNGYVVSEHTEVGQWISSGDPVAELVEVDQVDVEVMVLETYVGNLRIGTPARVSIDALPEDLFAGTVTHIVPRADSRSRTFPVKVRLANEILPDGSPLLKPGMFARVTLPVKQKQSALMAPKDALVLGGRQPVVYVVQVDEKDASKGIVQPVPVQLGVAYENLVEVAGNVQAGQQVVIEGNERLFPGQEVTLLPSERAEKAGKDARPAKGIDPAPAGARSKKPSATRTARRKE